MAQLLLLVWKNFVQQKRKPVTTLLQIVFPVLFMVVMALLRTTSKDTYKCEGTTESPGCEWKPFSVTNPEVPLLAVIGKTYGLTNISAVVPGIQHQVKVGYAPNNTFTNAAMNDSLNFLVSKLHPVFKLLLKFDGFVTEEAMVEHVMREANNESAQHKPYFASVVFDPDISRSSKKLDFAVRMDFEPRVNFEFLGLGSDPQQNGRKDWLTQFTFPQFIRQGPRADKEYPGGQPFYYANMFLHLQHSVSLGLIQALSNNTVLPADLPDVQMRRFPFPRYLENTFIPAVQFGLPLLVFLAYILTALVLVSDVVREKERRLKESMKMMGLSNFLHWAAWFVNYFFTLLISIVAMVLILKYGRVLEYSDPTLVLVFFLCHAWATIMFCFFVSTLFQRAVWGAAGGGIFWFLSYMPYFFVQQQYDTLSLNAKVGTSTFFNVAMAYGAQLIGNFEGQGVGVQWSNLNTGTSVDDTFTFASVLGMLVFDGFFYALLAWYIEGVYPGQFGLPLPLYFPFMPSYWCSTTSKVPEDEEEAETMPLTGSGGNNGAAKHLFEPEPDSVPAGVRSYRLRKVFNTDTGDLVAVDNVSLNMYEGQVTVLLGHNGAGKTTFISMLTGLFPPTKGTAFVNNCSITTNISGVRDNLGICPQHDVLFDNLTVQEHLEFYSQLKGCPKSQIKDEVDRMLAALKFTEFRQRRGKELSGGMKRKLSVGIALVGGSKVVILDEPTSGMDPAARRATWDLIQQFKADRTILLTTHFMDEADLLGDRIAIMSGGQLKCCGSSLFLKSRYGVGYHIVLVREEHCNIDRVVAMIQAHVPEAKLESTSGAELSLVLPKESAASFPAMFNELQANVTELGISSYGVSVTTMEEVFIKAGDEGHSLITEDKHAAASHEDSGSSVGNYGSAEVEYRSGKTNGRAQGSYSLIKDEVHVSVNEGPRRGLTPDMLNSGFALLWQQFYGLIVKRIIHTLRNKSGAFTQLFWPGLFTLLGLIATKVLPTPGNSPARLASYSTYGQSTLYYNGFGSPSSELYAASFAQQFNGSSVAAIPVPGGEFMTNYTDFGDFLRNETDAGGQNGIASFNKQHLTGVYFGTDELITVYFNNVAFHTVSESLAAVSNGLLQHYFNDTDTSISVTNHPLPRTAREEADQLRLDGNGFALSFDVLFGMAFLASSFVRLVVAERESKAKHVQFVSGVHPVSYWLSAYVWDMVNYMVPCLMLLILFAAFSVPAYTSSHNLGLVFLSLVMYGWAIIPLMYLVSFLFTKPASAFILLTLFNIITGEVAIIVIFILDILKEKGVADVLKWVFLILPNFNLGQALSDLYENYSANKLCSENELLGMVCRNEGIPWEANFLAWTPPGIGRYMAFLAIEGLVFFLLVLVVESDLGSVIRSSLSLSSNVASDLSDEDEDVRAERIRLQNLDAAGQPDSAKANPDILVIRDLNKYYNPVACLPGSSTHAVKGITVGVPARECFGLLGVNGAGKTTTFGMLTGDVAVSTGTAFLDGHSIISDQHLVRQRIGYCPQVNGLVDLLTGRELLTMFARLRGVPEKLIAGTVQRLIENLLLQKHADRPCGTYSGGNKRKLCTAIALVGDPPVVYLDEPTTGMDPVARRQLWQALCREREQGCCIVITSHSMEECEALCTRLAIMVSGRFRCLGSPQHLKNRFGDGYTVSARLSEGTPTTDLKTFMTSTFPECRLKEEHFGQVTYQVMNSTLANVFEAIETRKVELKIEDYSVTQTTLEQVFLLFARPDMDSNTQDWMK